LAVETVALMWLDHLKVFFLFAALFEVEQEVQIGGFVVGELTKVNGDVLAADSERLAVPPALDERVSEGFSEVISRVLLERLRDGHIAQVDNRLLVLKEGCCIALPIPDE